MLIRPNFLLLTLTLELHREFSRVRPVSALSHPESQMVKRLTPAVVLRIRVIVGIGRVILGTVPCI
jgi:hypothetical protein